MSLFNKVKICVENVILLILVSSCANDRINEYNTTVAQSDIPVEVRPVDKSAVKLSDGPLKRSVQLNYRQLSNAFNMLNLNKCNGSINPVNTDEIHSFYSCSMQDLSIVADYYECILLNFYPDIYQSEAAEALCQIVPAAIGENDFRDPEFKPEGNFTENDSDVHQEQIIYLENANELFVFQYIASELHWAAKNITIRQESLYPESHNIKFTITCQNPVRFGFNFRHPFWCTSGFKVLVNGKGYETGSDPGSYVSINRVWKNKDRIEIKMPFGLRIKEVTESPNQIVIFNGPLILAGKMEDKANKPVILSETRDPEPWVIPVEGKPNTYKTVGVGHPYDITLKPLYLCNNENYSIFWDIFTETTWKEYQHRMHVSLD